MAFPPLLPFFFPQALYEGEQDGSPDFVLSCDFHIDVIATGAQ